MGEDAKRRQVEHSRFGLRVQHRLNAPEQSHHELRVYPGAPGPHPPGPRRPLRCSWHTQLSGCRPGHSSSVSRPGSTTPDANRLRPQAQAAASPAATRSMCRTSASGRRRRWPAVPLECPFAPLVASSSPWSSAIPRRVLSASRHLARTRCRKLRSGPDQSPAGSPVPRQPGWSGRCPPPRPTVPRPTATHARRTPRPRPSGRK